MDQYIWLDRFMLPIIQPLLFFPKNVVCFLRLLHKTKCTSDDFYMEENNMSPDHLASK